MYREKKYRRRIGSFLGRITQQGSYQTIFAVCREQKSGKSLELSSVDEAIRDGSDQKLSKKAKEIRSEFRNRRKGESMQHRRERKQVKSDQEKHYAELEKCTVSGSAWETFRTFQAYEKRNCCEIRNRKK